jgi:hypothetical protein
MPSASSAEVVEAALGLGSFAGTVKERRSQRSGLQAHFLALRAQSKKT